MAVMLPTAGIEFALIQKFLISIAVGALMGTEREISKTKSGEKVSGVRTFSLITLMGTLLAHLSQEYPYLILVGAGAFSLLVMAGYLQIAEIDIGLTTEMGSLIAFLLGVLCYTETWLAVMLAVFVGIIFAIKEASHRIIHKMSERELIDTLKLALLALVILPFLPNEPIDPLNVLNPYRIWLIVVFISSIGYVGYFLIKIFGAKSGTGITGILGGLISSTAVAVTMSHRSQTSRDILFPALFATLIGNSIMFVRILVEVFVLNQMLVYELVFPMLAMMATGLATSLYFWKKQMPSHIEIEQDNPFTIKPALKFGAFFAVILVVSKLASRYFGEIGVYAAGIASGFADVDAITLSMATLAGGEISVNVAVTAIILASISNNITKMIIAILFGSKEFKKQMVIALAAIVAVGLIIIGFRYY